MDQMSLYYQATLTEVWAPRGQTPVVRMTPQRNHVHFYGALDVRGGRQIALPASEQTGDVTADFMRILLMLYPTQPILLLLDRASWNKPPACHVFPGRLSTPEPTGTGLGAGSRSYQP
jgi:hypothetical protein